MREFLEAQYAVSILRWDEPEDDGVVYEAILACGVHVRADSLALLLSQVQAWEPPGLMVLPDARAPLILAWAA